MNIEDRDQNRRGARVAGQEGGGPMSYAITKGDITVEELEPRECEEDGCDHPATHWIGIDIRAVGVKTILDGIYCKLHAQVRVERIRDGLLGDDP